MGSENKKISVQRILSQAKFDVDDDERTMLRMGRKDSDTFLCLSVCLSCFSDFDLSYAVSCAECF